MHERAVKVSLAFVVVVAGVSTAGRADSTGPQRQRVTLPMAFEANEGQTDPQVSFVSRGPGYTLFLTSSEAVLAHGSDAITMTFRGASPHARIVPIDRRPGDTNYLVGQDRSRWRRSVAAYAKVRYEKIYPGIDLVFYGNDRQLEYDLVVEPGADVRKIRIAFSGVRDLKQAGNGDLVARTRGGAEMRLRKPTIYQASAEGQASRSVEGRYRLTDGQSVAFEVADYDRRKPLVIDPVIVYSTYLGGVGTDQLRYGRQMIAVGPDGSAYVTGSTDSSDFPTTPGGAPPLPPTNSIFVVKLSPDGSRVVYVTRFGGIHGGDDASGIAVDASGNAYVTGRSFRPDDFPITTLRGTGNLFVTKLDPTGSQLVYSVRPVGADTSIGIAVGADGSAYVTGSTYDPAFPVTPGAFQTLCGGAIDLCSFGNGRPNTDAFVLKLDPAGSVAYGTFIGGRSPDVGTGIAVDAAGQVYVTGGTTSIDFPTTLGAFQRVSASAANVEPIDVFVTKLSADGSSAVFSTYLSSGAEDTPGSIAAGADGSAYVTGYTQSADFPTTVGAFQRTLPPSAYGTTPAFVTKFTPTGELAYSTFLAGVGYNQGVGIAVDGAGRAYVVGATDSPSFPTVDATQPTLAGNTDAFVSVLNASGSELVFSTYLGGAPGFDFAQGVALGPDGSAYVVGNTSNDLDPNFPTTAAAFQTVFGGGLDLFVSRIAVGPPPDTTPPVIGETADILAEATSASGAVVSFVLPGATDAVDPDPSVSAAPASGSTFALGTTTVTITATDASGNASEKTFGVTVHDTTPPVLTLPASITVAATMRAGAIVTYSAGASDAVAGTVTATCTPVSGSTFSIGTTAVHCSAADGSGNVATGTFSVAVLGPAQLALELFQALAHFPQGRAILLNVLHSLERRDTVAACNQLGAFLNMVAAQSGKTLTVGQASALTLGAVAVRAALGCR